jgi:hypothetical protein
MNIHAIFTDVVLLSCFCSRRTLSVSRCCSPCHSNAECERSANSKAPQPQKHADRVKCTREGAYCRALPGWGNVENALIDAALPSTMQAPLTATELPAPLTATQLRKSGIQPRNVVRVINRPGQTLSENTRDEGTVLVVHFLRDPALAPSAPPSEEFESEYSTEVSSTDSTEVSSTESEEPEEVAGWVQIYACLQHKLSRREVCTVVDAGYPIVCVHGRDDVIVSLRSGRKVAAGLKAELVVLEGGHDLLHECGSQVRAHVKFFKFKKKRKKGAMHGIRGRHLHACVWSFTVVT